MKVKKVKRVQMHKDGAKAVVTFGLDDDTSASLEFDFASLLQTTKAMMALAAQAQRQNHSFKASELVTPQQPANFRVGATDQGRSILIAFGLHSGLRMEYALPLEASKVLSERLGIAVRRCASTKPDKPN
jgi:hypothetical protein